MTTLDGSDDAARFQALAAIVESAVVVVDAANVVRFANGSAAQLLEADDLLGRPFALPLRSTASGPVILPLASGRALRAVATVAPTVWAGAAAWIATLRPQVSLLSEVGPLVDDALAVMRGRFLAHVSHELRTPLNSIVGFAELLALAPHGPLGRDDAAAARYRGYAEDIRWAGTRMATLVDDLLDLAGVEAGELRLDESRFELGPLLAEILHEASATARRGPPPVLGAIDPVVIAGDRARLKRALIHLVVNGLSSGGGEVALSATGTRDGRVRLRISDRGDGFAPEALARAGEAFARARQLDRAEPDAGVGIGLAVARHMFELHGGGLRIESRAGHGATVTCTLPSRRVARPPSGGVRH